MSWTDKEVETLKALHKDGHSASQIARRLRTGKSRNAVIGKIHRLGLGGRDTPTRPVKVKRFSAQKSEGGSLSTRWTKADTATLIRLHGEGASDSEIARQVERDVTSIGVGNKRRDLGLPSNLGGRRKKRLTLCRNQDGSKGLSFGGVFEADDQQGAITLGELTGVTCRWPLDGPSKGRAADHLFCGRGVKEGSVYCPEHHAISYTGKVSKTRRRKLKAQQGFRVSGTMTNVFGAA